MTSPSWVKFHNSHSFSGMTNDVCVRDTRPQRPRLCSFLFFFTQIWGSENRRTEDPTTLVKMNCPSPGVTTAAIAITKQIIIQLPNLARGRRWGRAWLITRTPACSHMPGWFELTSRTTPVTPRVNHRFDAVSKQSFTLSITLRSAVCEQVVQVFSPQSAQVRTGSARQGTQWWLQPIVCPVVAGLTD